MFEVLNKFAFNNVLTRKIQITAVKFDVKNKTNGVIWKGRHGVCTKSINFPILLIDIPL